MSDEPKKPKSRHWIGWVLFALFLLAYPLSIGPARMSMRKSASSLTKQKIFDWTYAPILWLRRHSDSTRKVIDWYVLRFWDA
jgi:hypothetical protein